MAKAKEEMESVIPENLNREQEVDILTNLLEAADYVNHVTTAKIVRNGKHMFDLHLHPISEADILTARKKATSYMPNPNGKNLPPIEKDFDPSLYRSWRIFLATTDEDKKAIWGNKAVKDRYNIMDSAKVVDLLLTAGEKDMVYDLIDEISGFGSDSISTEEYAKN